MIRVGDDDVVVAVVVDLDPDREGGCFLGDFFWSVKGDARDGGGGGGEDFEEGPFA